MEDIGTGGAEGAENGTEAEAVYPGYAYLISNAAAINATSPSEGKENEVARIIPTGFYQIIDVLSTNIFHRLGNQSSTFLYGNAKRFCQLFCDNLASKACIQFPLAAQEVVRINVTQDDTGVGGSSFRAAQSVTCRAWHGTGAIRAYLYLFLIFRSGY